MIAECPWTYYKNKMCAMCARILLCGLSPPVVGEFKDGRGEFFGQESFNGRMIFVRFVISDITPTSCRFEQAFSDDGGKTWEANWIAVDTRVSDDTGRRHLIQD